MTGFVYENYLNDVAKAKVAYQELMTKYPDSELAEEAKLAIENAGVNPEEIIKRAQQNGADSTVSVK
jgi:hypothetical protein